MTIVKPPVKYEHRGWYVSLKINDYPMYLHTDGMVYKTASNDNGEFTGYFSSEKEAYKTIRIYFRDHINLELEQPKFGSPEYIRFWQNIYDLEVKHYVHSTEDFNMKNGQDPLSWKENALFSFDNHRTPEMVLYLKRREEEHKREESKDEGDTMITHLAIYGIPKDKHIIKQIAEKLGDTSWAESNYETWAKDDTYNGIEYTESGEYTYNHSRRGQESYNQIITYDEFCKDYNFKPEDKFYSTEEEFQQILEDLDDEDGDIYDGDIYDDDCCEESDMTDERNYPKRATADAVKQRLFNKTQGNKMKKIAAKVTTEVRALTNESGAADIAIGKLLYSNMSSVLGRTVVKIPVMDKVIAKFSKKMKLKNEVIRLSSTLVLLVGLKQVYDHKMLSNVRGYIVNRLYNILIEATGMDDVLALVDSALAKEKKTEKIED